MTTKDSYAKFLAEVRKASGIEAFVPDEAGLVSVRVDDAYNVNLQFVEATGKVLCFIEVTELPYDAPKAVYRDLLAGGLFGKVHCHVQHRCYRVPHEQVRIDERHQEGEKRVLSI